MDATVRLRPWTRACLAVAIAWTSSTVSAAPPEFRIETEVYVGEEVEPASHTVILFEESAVYEFSDNPAQTIVYREPSEGRPAQFVILDPATHRRTDVEAERVTRLMEKLCGWAKEQKDDLLKFSADPQFDETFDAGSGDLTLANKLWTYRVATVPAVSKEALTRYRAFTDRYAELTSMLENTPPPRPRLALNEALVKNGVAPVEIRRIISGDEKNAVRATHLFTWRLSRDDRSRLDEARQQVASFKKVENKEFLAARAKVDKASVSSK